MQRALIAIRAAKKSFPDDVLASILAKYNTAIGFAITDGTSVRATRITKSDKWEPTVKSIQDGDAQFKDQKVIWCFQDIDDAHINTADLQPFSIVTGDQNNDLVVAFLDGHFPASSSNAISPARSLVESYLRPRLQKEFKYVDKNVGKFMDELTDPNIGRDIVNQMIGDNGSILVLAADDQNIAFFGTDDKTNKEYDWGWLSNTDFLQKQEAAQPADPFQAAVAATKASTAETKAAPKSSGFGRPASAVPQVAPVASPDTGKPAQPDVKPEVEGEQFVEVKVPKNCDNPKSKGKFLRSRYPDALPNDWYNTFNEFTIPLSRAPEKLRADIAAGKPYVRVFTKSATVQDLAAKYNGNKPAAATKPATAPVKSAGFGRPASNAAPAAQPVTKPKDVEPHHKPDKQVVTDRIWLVPPDSKKAMLEFMNTPAFGAKLDRNSQKIADPGTYGEVGVPSFVAQLGHPNIKDIFDCSEWDEEQELHMIKEHPILAWHYTRSWRLEAIKLQQKLHEATRKKLDTQAEEQHGPPAETKTKQPTMMRGGFGRPAKVA